MVPQSSFDVRTSVEQVTDPTLVVGLAHHGMAGVTAADHLVRHLGATQTGHLAPGELPAIAPFEEGVPRHHSRLYSVGETNLSVLVGELFVPVRFARAFADGLLEFVEEHSIEEIVVLHGVPYPHGPDEHEVFSVATPRYRDRRMADGTVQPLQGGFLDGVVGELVTRSLDETGPETGVFVTPSHPPGPDVDAALRLIGALESTYGLDVDETELRKLGREVTQYYEQLADRLSTVAEAGESLDSRTYPEDRMFM